MKRYFGIIVALVFVVVAIVFTFRKFNEKTAEAGREQSLLRIKADTLERIAWVRVNPDEKSYRDEVTTFFRWYFKEVNDHLNKFGGNRNFDDYLTELDNRAGKGGKGEEKLEERKQVYEQVKKVFESFKGNNYSPYWTGTDKGIRLDIVSASATNVGPDPSIHMPIVVWGLPRDDKTDEKGTHRILVNGNFKFNWRLLDEKGKLIGEMPGEGLSGRVDWPDRYIKYFPPGFVLGYWDIGKLPPEVKKVEITMNIGSRSVTGGDINAEYKWNLDAPAEWKLGVGETWKGAQESIRPEEEIDPNAGKKTAKK